MYFDRVYFGAGGRRHMTPASRRYFGKPAAPLTLAEASTLAGILPSPARYAPDTNPDAAHERQRLVLRAMVEEGYIAQREADLAREGQVVAVSRATSAGSYVADWVAGLISISSAPSAATSSSTPRSTPTSRSLRRTRSRRASPSRARRWTPPGRARLDEPRRRRAGPRRRPGLCREPVQPRGQCPPPAGLLVQAFRLPHRARARSGVPETIRVDQPVTINGWSPQNFSGEYAGPVTLQRALAMSLNTVSVQLTEVGAEAVVATARRLGITTPLEPNPSIALGTSKVSVLEMTGAYAAFANGGNRALPYVIRRISTEDGEVLYQRTGGGPGAAVDIRYVGMMKPMMRETLKSGTGRGAVIDGWDAAGKTCAPARSSATPGSSATPRTSSPASGSATTTTPRPTALPAATCRRRSWRVHERRA